MKTKFKKLLTYILVVLAGIGVGVFLSSLYTLIYSNSFVIAEKNYGLIIYAGIFFGIIFAIIWSAIESYVEDTNSKEQQPNFDPKVYVKSKIAILEEDLITAEMKQRAEKLFEDKKQ